MLMLQMLDNCQRARITMGIVNTAVKVPLGEIVYGPDGWIHPALPRTFSYSWEAAQALATSLGYSHFSMSDDLRGPDPLLAHLLLKG